MLRIMLPHATAPPAAYGIGVPCILDRNVFCHPGVQHIITLPHLPHTSLPLLRPQCCSATTWPRCWQARCRGSARWRPSSSSGCNAATPRWTRACASRRWRTRARRWAGRRGFQEAAGQVAHLYAAYGGTRNAARALALRCSPSWLVTTQHLSYMHLQATVRSKHGEATTAFERITDGSRTAAAGDVVRINAKPQLVGRVLFFTIPQASCHF